MNSPRILLFGKIGQVGWELRRTLAPMSELVCVDYPDVDLTRPDSIRKWVQDSSPEIIINAAAFTAVDKAETDTALAMKINGEAPGIMAVEAKKRGALLVHYSTDYVFDPTSKRTCQIRLAPTVAPSWPATRQSNRPVATT
jgi:dTDP-4-dehydrorhamnose reductase